MRHIPARSEQPQSPIEIIRAALRDAATAPTIIDALDLTGDALRRLADLAALENANARFSGIKLSSNEIDELLAQSDRDSVHSRSAEDSSRGHV